MHWRLARTQAYLGDPCYLGILNLTPDSFSDGGAYSDPAAAADHGLRLLAQGARIIDLGAESTRPGARPVEPREEWARLAPVIGILRNKKPDVILSIDTRHHEVVRMALGAGADVVEAVEAVEVINDVTGFQDPRMLELASGSKCGLIATRSRMKDGRMWMPDYTDPSPKTADGAVAELKEIRDRLLGAGVEPERILLDPGFGFGTTFLEDRAIWDALPELPALLGWPAERLCVGISRKRFVARSFGISDNDSLDAKTAHLHKIAMNADCKVFRTHSLRG
jgi:dihydropteroate synthase